MAGLTPAHLLLILVIALVVIGPGKLPEVGSAIGKSVREFQKATGQVPETPAAAPTPPPMFPAQQVQQLPVRGHAAGPIPLRRPAGLRRRRKRSPVRFPAGCLKPDPLQHAARPGCRRDPAVPRPTPVRGRDRQRPGGCIERDYSGTAFVGRIVTLGAVSAGAAAAGRVIFRRRLGLRLPLHVRRRGSRKPGQPEPIRAEMSLVDHLVELRIGWPSPRGQ